MIDHAGYTGGYETTYTSYGGGGGGGGGGFIQGDGSQASPSGQKSGYTEDSVRPVTIKQILEAQQNDKDFLIDGASVKHVRHTRHFPGC